MLRTSRMLLFLSLLMMPAFAAERVGGVRSGGATIMLRAVLAQSLSVSAQPQPGLFNSFVESNAPADFPVTFKTNWVRGPGSVSVVVLSSSGWTRMENEQPVSVMAPGHVPAMEIESGMLPFSADNKNEVLTIRAQVI